MDQGYHWNANAETYWLIGRAMGEAMVPMACGKKSSGAGSSPER